MCWFISKVACVSVVNAFFTRPISFVRCSCCCDYMYPNVDVHSTDIERSATRIQSNGIQCEEASDPIVRTAAAAGEKKIVWCYMDAYRLSISSVRFFFHFILFYFQWCHMCISGVIHRRFGCKSLQSSSMLTMLSGLMAADTAHTYRRNQKKTNKKSNGKI